MFLFFRLYFVDAQGNAEMTKGLSVRKVETLIGLLRRVLAIVEVDGIRVDTCENQAGRHID
jgi:hypothetical protein